MRLFATFGLAGLMVLSLTAQTVAGKAAPPPPLAFRLARAEVAVLGKVTAIEPKSIKAPRWQGDTEGGEFQVAVVKIDEALVGAKGLTHVKAGFLPTPAGRRGMAVSLKPGQEVCIFLRPNINGSFLQVTGYYDVLDKESPTFAKDVELVKKYARLLADPMAGLKSKDMEDRLTTAGILLGRYRDASHGVQQKPIDEAESKLILEALAGADWASRADRDYQMSPQALFQLLGATDKDGWLHPQDFNRLADEAKKWLKDNSGKYRIKKYENDKAEK